MAHSILTPRARELRTHDTRAEARLWQALRNRNLGGWKWKRQVPRGPYIVDFLCVEAGLIVEVDGATHNEDHEIDYDERRTAYLNTLGLKVLRVTNTGVFEDTNSICLWILEACELSRGLGAAIDMKRAADAAPLTQPLPTSW